jgi:hypothetical protein
MKYGKKLLALFIALMLVSGMVLSAHAEENSSYPQRFYDVPKDHWAFTYIAELVERGAINGYSDGSYKPNNTVTRAEWAKIMVVAADRPLSDSVPTFNDMSGHWANQWVNAAKPYMTSYEGGSAFRPNIPTLREDVTVALVKLKGYNADDADFSYIAKFKDQDSISTNCKKYVAVAVETGLISGFEDGTFKGQNTLTRAEAATLLWRAFQKGNDDKVVDGIQLPADGIEQTPEPTPTPEITPTPTPTPSPTLTPAPAPPQAPSIKPGNPSEYGTVFSGTITYSGQEDSYTYIASVSGKFRFDIVADFGVRMRLYNSNGKELAYTYSTTNDGFNADLIGGESYNIKVFYYSSFPTINEYVVKVGVPSTSADVSGLSSFAGRLTFTGEEDAFSYTADISGRFRFDVTADFGVRLRIYNANEKELAYTYSTTNDGFNIDLVSGDRYIIKVFQYSSFPTINEYMVKIGIPNASVDVTGLYSFNGNLTFTGEEDSFTYTAFTSGKFRFDVIADFGVRMRLYNKNGKELAYTYGTTKDGFNADLASGENYIIKIFQYSAFAGINSYTISINS